MRHWGGDHIFPGSAKAKPSSAGGKPAAQAALSVPTHGEQSLAPRELPSVTRTKGETLARHPPVSKADAPSNEKTDRKTYLREYMRARRQREREEAQRVVEAGTGATDQ
jgi:hypothetical protein